MEIEELFKDKNRKKRAGVTDFINRIVQVLKKDLYWFRLSTQDVELMELGVVKLYNKTQYVQKFGMWEREYITYLKH